MHSRFFSTPSRILGWVAGISFGLTLLAQPLSACSIPVFRYALEFWEPDPYEFIILHRGPLSEPDAKRMQELAAASKATPPANLTVSQVDLDGTLEEPIRSLWEKHQSDSLPHVIVRYPESYLVASVAAAFPLADLQASAWAHSPSRQEIVKRISQGETAVWVFIDSGNKEKDDAAFKTLEETLTKLESSLALPEPSTEESTLRELGLDKEPTGLRIAFSTIRLTKNDTQEQPLVQQLMRSEPDLEELSVNPMTFAIFGRGRMLPGLVGGGISPDIISEVGQFLVGPCSCQVKAENPGADLIFSADWASVVPDNNDEPDTPVEERAPLNVAGLVPPLANKSAPKDVPVVAKLDAGPETAAGTASTSANEGVPKLPSLTATVSEQPVARPDVPSTVAADGATESTAERESPLLRSVLLLAGIGVLVLLIGTILLTKKSN